jgi:hypothetical protein
VSSLPDAERDACDVVQALGGLAALLTRLSPDDPAFDDAVRILRSLAEDGSAAAQRLVSYLQSLRGAGDGESTPVPPRLGPWREWVPPRGHLLGNASPIHRIGEMPRRLDPGE